MVHITVKQSPQYHQMTMDELFSFEENARNPVVTLNASNTITYRREKVSQRFLRLIDLPELINTLEEFNKSTEDLRAQPRTELYHSFAIPKKTGGLRKIDAPCQELMAALRTLKVLFEEKFYALHHTSAFAYVHQRSTIDAVKRHQANESKWFGKFDLSNFFGSTTLDFVLQQLSLIFPFSEVMRVPQGFLELSKALELAFLNGGLPQGTPISPLITNVMMIPIDFDLNKELMDFEKQNYIYTRYADDFIVSSKYEFDVKKIEGVILQSLSEAKAPFVINSSKTRYGSSSGSNWNLGVMLNKDNNITIGHKAKKRLQTMLHNYALDKRNSNSWDLNDVQVLDGHINYYKMVEGDVITSIINHMSNKTGVNIQASIKADLRG